jgi:Tol biopolymer transport system component
VAAFVLPWVVVAPPTVSANNLTFWFSTLANGSHTLFDTNLDHLVFDAGATATKVTLTEAVGSLGLTYAGKTIWLDSASLPKLSPNSISFGDNTFFYTGDGWTTTVDDDNSNLLHLLHGATPGVYINGLGGADDVSGSDGSDLILGNGPITPVTLVSQLGGVRSPKSSSGPTVSADGNYVGFSGGWTAFGSAPSSNPTDVIVKNMRAGTVTNEHRDSAGTLGLSGSGQARLSADGSTLVFQSSSLLVPNAPASTVYAASTTSNAIGAVSTDAIGGFANRPSGHPDVSADGRYVVFTSNATNLIGAGNDTFADCFLKDRTTGDLTLLSHDASGGDGNADCVDPHISPKGDYVVFSSAATNLAASGPHTAGAADVFLWTRQGAILTDITGGLPGGGSSSHPDVTADSGGQPVVAFDTLKKLQAADTNGQRDVYRYRGANGTVALVSTTSTGAQVGLASESPSISSDGGFVAFRAFSDALVPGDSNGWADVVVKSMSSGAIALVSRTASAQANGPSEQPEISSGGDWIVFQSSAASLSSVAGARAPTDVYRVSNPLLKDRLAGGLGNDTYVEDRADTIVEAAGAGTDLVKASTSFTLPANVENLTLTGAALNGTGNASANRITGNAANNRLDGGAGNDRLDGGAGKDVLIGGPGADLLIGGAGADLYALNSAVGTDTVSGFVSGSDRVSLQGLRIGDRDSIVERSVVRAAPGGFAPGAELVVMSRKASGLSAAAASAAIGKATGSYSKGARRIFVVNNGTDTRVFLFVASGPGPTVSGAELTALAVVKGVHTMRPASFVFTA